MITSSICSGRASSLCSISVLFETSRSAFGAPSVRDPILLPRPAARMTHCIPLEVGRENETDSVPYLITSYNIDLHTFYCTSVVPAPLETSLSETYRTAGLHSLIVSKSQQCEAPIAIRATGACKSKQRELSAVASDF